VGLDQSQALLKVARQRVQDNPKARFYQVDLVFPGWQENLPQPEFSAILCFAVLHHIPGEGLRRAFLEKVHECLALSGSFFHSEWQFLNSERLRARLQPWDRIGLSPEQVEPGDYLLDWREGGLGFRYVHHFTPEQLVRLAEETGFAIVESFLSDGEENKLGLYQVWKRV
jgi:hypothetical protein